jgi:predicted negative regulator of RcsB-dependent stress response
MQTSDKEQIQMIKDWWKKYGNMVLVLVLVFAVTNFGWRYWLQYKQKNLERASISYTQMLVSFEQKKYDEGKLYADLLMDKFTKSPYASLAALFLAKEAVQKGELESAQRYLQFVVKKSANNELRQLARIREARVLIALKKAKQALDLLVVVNDKAYQAEIYEIMGDAYMQLGQKLDADNFYQKAKDIAPADIKSPLLKLKMRQF